MHPNDPKSLNFGLVPPLGLGLGLCLGLFLGLGLGYHWFLLAHFIQHVCSLLRLKQQIQNCFNISLFDFIQQFLLNFLFKNNKNYKMNKKNEN